MKKTIVTTTIYPPSKATKLFCNKKDWNMIIIGDLKTPHKDYFELEKNYSNVRYISPDEQTEKYPELSASIGWNCIMRRNIGFVEAYKDGSEILATIDDDNIPYESWGRDLFIGREIECDLYNTEDEVFDPLFVTEHSNIWHRGFPPELISSRDKSTFYAGKVKRKVLIQADLWDGNPDIDATARLLFNPCIKINKINKPYTSNRISPFNSQNTFLHRSVIPYYAVLPHVGRMDDIWGSYIIQKYFKNSLIYCKPSVYQERNEQNVFKNLRDELMGYEKTLDLIRNIDRFQDFLPEETLDFWKNYRNCF